MPHDGRDLARTSRTARSGLRQRLRNSPLRHLARIAAAAAPVKPELAELFKLPGANLSEQEGLASKLVRMVKQLDGMMLYRIQEQPELAGAWISARNVA